ncbi:MAG TPA: hypothetical protein VFH06_00790 [Candidatus Saccharimonadales bacterium]|nr:hypothetical protein [Candidatus Saccharimonadales bacterium]
MQVQQFVQTLQKAGHRIDQVSDVTPARLNAGWETETKEKTRKVSGKAYKVTKNTKVAEVVVVAPSSNCKFELELPLNRQPTDAYYADEGRSPEGKEANLDSRFNTDRPSPAALQDYVKTHRDLAFCAGKPFAPSPHAND